MDKKKDIMGYTILKKIGKGSYGTVFKVQRKNDKQIFALKYINI